MVKAFLKEITPILLEKNGFEQDNFIATLIFGSWNHGLRTSQSDADLVIITKTGRFKVTQEILGEVQFLSINCFISYLNKRDVKYWEILLTEYSYINPSYESIWKEFGQKMIGQIDHKDFLLPLKNKIQEHFDYLLWIPAPTKLKEYYHQKRMYLLLRQREHYENIKAGMTFQDSLVHQNRFYSNLVEIKTIPNYLSLEQVNKIVNEFKHFLSTEIPPYKKENPVEQELIKKFLEQISE